jgi:hypothetical protein
MTDAGQSQPNEWMQTGRLMLEEYFHRLPKSSLRWPPSWDIPLSATILHQVLLRHEASCSKEVDEAISEWAQTGIWRPMSDRAVVFIEHPRKPAAYIFTDHVLPEAQGCTAIVPFPDLPPRQVIQWVLTDWWRQLGSLKLCEILIIEYLEARRMTEHGMNN